MDGRLENEDINLKVIYQDREYELEEQELDRIIAIASKRLRGEIVASKLGLGILSVKNLAEEAKLNPGLKVIKNGFESELYHAMNETLLYAIEMDMLENYRVDRMEPIIEPIMQTRPAQTRPEENNRLKPDIDLTEIYSRRLQNFFRILSTEISL